MLYEFKVLGMVQGSPEVLWLEAIQDTHAFSPCRVDHMNGNHISRVAAVELDVISVQQL